jgi:predicted nucleic acid-binding Zn ribbon protein
MFCTKCGTTLPNDAVFCSKCGNRVGGGGAPAGGAPAAAPAASARPTLAAAGVEVLKCPTCGAPIKPTFGDTVVSCEYCGASVTLGGDGWKQINKHTMLLLKVTDPNAALKVVHDHVDQGFFHRHEFEESKVVETKLSYVPFWILPATASTTYKYQDAAASIGGTVGTIAAASLIGGALGGRRGGFAVVPILGGPVVNPTRSETISGQFQFPIVAVKSLNAYQPREYQFALDGRTLFDKKNVPENTPILNGDLDEGAAQVAAKAYVEQLQSDIVHKKHSMVSDIQSRVEVQEGELLHTPIWYFTLDRKGKQASIVVDANAGKVIHTAF